MVDFVGELRKETDLQRSAFALRWRSRLSNDVRNPFGRIVRNTFVSWGSIIGLPAFWLRVRIESNLADDAIGKRNLKDEIATHRLNDGAERRNHHPTHTVFPFGHSRLTDSEKGRQCLLRELPFEPQFAQGNFQRRFRFSFGLKEFHDSSCRLDARAIDFVGLLSVAVVFGTGEAETAVSPLNGKNIAAIKNVEKSDSVRRGRF